MTRQKLIFPLAFAAIVAAGCGSEDAGPRYAGSAASGGAASSAAGASSAAESEDGSTTAAETSAEESSETVRETDTSPAGRLAALTEADVADFEVSGEPLAEGTYFRNDAGTVQCLFNDYNQFCNFPTVRDYAALSGGQDIVCDTTRDGNNHTADLYIGWNPSPGMGDLGGPGGLCALDGGYPVRGQSPELAAGEKISITIGVEGDDPIVCGNDADTIICSYRDHGFTASGEAVSNW